jgi:hypothetical protein
MLSIYAALRSEEIFIVFFSYIIFELPWTIMIWNTWCVCGGENACCGEGLTFIDILLNIMRVSLLTFIFQFPCVEPHKQYARLVCVNIKYQVRVEIIGWSKFFIKKKLLIKKELCQMVSRWCTNTTQVIY